MRYHRSAFHVHAQLQDYRHPETTACCAWTVDPCLWWSDLNRKRQNASQYVHGPVQFLLGRLFWLVWITQTLDPWIWFVIVTIYCEKVLLGHERWWCNGQHWCLPSIRSGFDSRPSHIFFYLNFPSHTYLVQIYGKVVDWGSITEP